MQSSDPDIDEFYQVVYRFNDTQYYCEGSQYYRPLGQVGVFGGYNLGPQTLIKTNNPIPDSLIGNKSYIAEVGNGSNGGWIISGHHDGYYGVDRDTNWPLGTELWAGSGDRWVVTEEVNSDVKMNTQGLCFVVMHDEPDTTAPYVSGHMPLDNATGVPVDTFIHAHIPETIRTETLPGSVVVRNNTTNEIVTGMLQISHTGTIGMFPDEDLEKDTTYTVTISGIQDFMGNTMETVNFSFTTGQELDVTPAPAPIDDDEPAPTIDAAIAYLPNQSSQLSCLAESVVDNIWTVNPDNNSVTIIDTNLDSSNNLVLGESNEVFVNYKTPTSITRIDSYYAVTFRDDDKVVFFDSDAQPMFSLNTGYGSQPIASVVDDNDNFLYVALYGYQSLLKLDVVNIRHKIVNKVDELPLGPTPKAMALHGHRLLVTRYISEQEYGEVYDINVNTMTMNTIRINKVTVANDPAHGTGVPNFLNSVVISADGNEAYVIASKANTANDNINGENTVRAMMATIDLTTGQDINEGDTANPNKTIDFDNRADPSAVTILPDGVSRAVAFQGNNQLEITKLGANQAPARENTGLAPQSICTTLRTTYVKNFTDRSVTAIDTSGLIHDGRSIDNRLTISTVSTDTEILVEEELAGLQVFYHASEEMGSETYMSCATCHQDGGQDGLVWDLTGLGEGLRNTLSLNGTSGTRFGDLHWSQNFDEVQDFEIQLEQLNQGDGFIPGVTFNTGDTPLEETTSNRSDKLDALAVYIASLGKSTLKKSPYRDPVTGDLTAEAMAGEVVFNNLGCADCHSGQAFRDGLAHDVGTIDPNDNQAYGEAGALTQIRTPTLVDLFETPPYLHNGSAATLEEVFDAGGVHSVPEENQADLVEFLNSIDQSMFIDDDATFTPNSGS